MKTELRLTDTNAASDSKGRTWGLEGGLFWWLVGGIGAGITVFFVLLVMLKSSLADRLCASHSCRLVCASPTSSACGRANRPVTTGTFSSAVFTGSGFAPDDQPASRHPLGGQP